MKKTHSQQNWSTILGPAGGSVSSLAVIHGDNPGVFLGSQIGIFHLTWGVDSSARSWTRLENSPLGVLCLVSTKNSAGDPILLAGTTEGVYFSENLGQTWSSARLPLSSSTILSLAVSPNFLEDRLALAGTLEDGIFFSNNAGRRWQSQSFGMLDASVFSIAFSPAFVQDGTVFIGTESGIYHSYNHALAWKHIDFPEELAPVLSLAVSPEFTTDRLLLAGTEANGLFSSHDLGDSWQKVNLPSMYINALHLSSSGELLAATQDGVFSSIDLGENWTCVIPQPGAINLASDAGLNLAGFLENGAWFQQINLNQSIGQPWRPLEGLPIRGFTQMVISRHFDTDRTAFLASPQEGIWTTRDGGQSWLDLTGSFPGEMINQVSRASFLPQPGLIVSSDNGLFLNQVDGGDWLRLSNDPCTLFTITPDGRTLLAVFPGKGIYKLTLTGREVLGGLSTQELQGSWEAIPGPWEKGGQVLAMSCQKGNFHHIALLENLGETLSIYQGIPGDIELVHSQPAGENPLVSFWIPSEPAADRPWFASLGEKVWKFSARRGGISEELPLFPERTGEPIVVLSGATLKGQINLFACTGRRIFHLLEGGSWSAIYDFGEDRAVDFCPSPRFAEEPLAYALVLGGKILYGNLLEG